MIKFIVIFFWIENKNFILKQKQADLERDIIQKKKKMEAPFKYKKISNKSVANVWFNDLMYIFGWDGEFFNKKII